MKQFLLLASLLLALPMSAQAQSFRVPSLDDGRTGKWDFTFQLSTNESKTYDGEMGSSLSLQQRTGFGFGGAYNFNEHLALGFDLNFSSPRYTATLAPTDPSEAPVVINHRADITTGQFKGIWNILKSKLTPYVEAGGGFTYVDSNVVDSDVPPVCWYDPWYGTQCSVSSYNDTDFSYGGAVGLRWDTTNNLLFKISVNTLTINTSNDPSLNSIRFEIGARY